MWPPKPVPTAEHPVLHSLLYLDENENTHVNLKSDEDPLNIYISCASLCAASIRYHGHAFRLITNNHSVIESRLAALRLPEFEVLEMPFTLDVPRGINFYGAHFKLEIYKMFGRGDFGNSVGIVDLDSVMVSPLDCSGLSPTTLMAYDITEQVLPKFGAERIRSDIELIGGTAKTQLRWLGGEFLLGSYRNFQALSDAISSKWTRYLSKFHDLHHLGDEMVVAAAISTMTEPCILDGGSRGCIARWWTARTAHRQPPFAAIKNRSILHLPADKEFLARQAKIPFHPSTFTAAFEKAVAGKLLRRRTANVAERLLKRDPKYAARLR